MGQMTAKVAVAKAIYAIDRPYDYRVPCELEERLQPGMRVLVPFGTGDRGSDGIVLALDPEPSEQAKKDVIAVLDSEPVLDEKLLRLALWMREQYFCTAYDAAKAMLPAGLYYALRDSIALKEEIQEDVGATLKDLPDAQRLMELLLDWGGSGDMEQIRMAFGAKDPANAVNTLLNRGFAERVTSAQRGVGDKKEKLAVLAMPAEEALSQVAPRRRTAPLRYAVTELLCQLGAAPAKEICYFTGASMATLRSLEKSGILTLEEHVVFRRPAVEAVEPAGPIVLNSEQELAFHGIYALLQEEKAAAALLYGVTGSGKTQVYLRLMQETLKHGKTALFLVPEIALTPQLLRIVAAHFGDQVAILHSSLRTGERYDEWKRIRSGDATVVIGTRSAVFAPLENLGFIILDEEQEASYKSENNPRYHTREVAKYRCVQENALLLLGSATPSVETMYNAQIGRYHCFVLHKRYNQKALPDVKVVDMKEELRVGNSSSISRTLRLELEENLVRGEQAILFLNRRGANRMVSCGECGFVPECPRCSVKLTYHSANRRLMCHHCGFSQPLPPACPKCGGGLNFIGVGTQKVQEELEELFPQTPVLRMDTDTVTASRSHEAILEEFRRKRVPILVGTQMVAKGLDFENVTLVGVILADQSLFVDDFRAGEHTFSLLTQVVGRAGRGEKTGRALIQTYTPEHDVIHFSAEQDYDHFYEAEVQLRRLRGEPPFYDIFLITASGVHESHVLQTCVQLRKTLEERLRQTSQFSWQLLGPAPAPVAKVNNRYRYRLTLTAKNVHSLRLLLAELLQSAHRDKENRGISIYIDVNPY